MQQNVEPSALFGRGSTVVSLRHSAIVAASNKGVFSTSVEKALHNSLSTEENALRRSDTGLKKGRSQPIAAGELMLVQSAVKGIL
ncbi:hypothetical protein DVH05_015498 [Phytophthora capsici]|nr:hypothetical protein DVH05_020721 [Phytophthora capsici]KAG1698014.1 hypothetical protein DVH05_015498 [Phytophthora capsici]